MIKYVFRSLPLSTYELDCVSECNLYLPRSVIQRYNAFFFEVLPKEQMIRDPNFIIRSISIKLIPFCLPLKCQRLYNVVVPLPRDCYTFSFSSFLTMYSLTKASSRSTKNRHSNISSLAHSCLSFHVCLVRNLIVFTIKCHADQDFFIT